MSRLQIWKWREGKMFDKDWRGKQKNLDGKMDAEKIEKQKKKNLKENEECLLSKQHEMMT